jgi:hypothetical protein
MTTDPERRGDPRLAVALQGKWEERGEAHACRITNLSRGGCYVESNVLPSKGARIHLTIHLSVVASLSTEAEVMHQKMSGIGVRFVGLDADQQRILALAWTALAREARG